MSTTTKTASKENVPRLPSAGQARFAFSVLFLVNILNYADRYVLPAILPKIADPKQGLGLTSFQQGLLGAAIGFTFGGLIADAFGWRYAFFFVGIPGLISAFLAWRMLEPRRGAFDSSQQSTDEIPAEVVHGSIGKDFWGTVKKLRSIPTYWVLVGALVFSFFTIGGTSFWLPTYFVDTFQLSVGQAGVISGAVLVSSGLVGTVV